LVEKERNMNNSKLSKEILDKLATSLDTLKEAVGDIHKTMDNRTDMSLSQRLRLIEYDKIILKQQKLLQELRKKCRDNPEQVVDENVHRSLEIIGQLALMLQDDTRDLYMELTYNTSAKDRFYDA
jgi:hypothetical protein